ATQRRQVPRISPAERLWQARKHSSHPGWSQSRTGGCARPTPLMLHDVGFHMIYLDNAATSFPKPEVVYQALDAFARTKLANPGRSSHRMAKDAERMIDDTRLALDRFFNGEGYRRWVFTLNCTDGLNIAIKGTLRPGDHAITTDLEHNY